MLKFLFLFLIFIILPVFAYEIYSPENYSFKDSKDNILFVVDFSNSMSEYLEHKTKVTHVKETLDKILPQISPETKVGLRVYGHTCNLFAYNACRSSELLVPLKANNSKQISTTISKLRPRGMTPITYSLKQAVKKDFNNLNGLKHIILLTDGGENCDESPCDYAISLIKTRKDINIDVVAYNVSDDDDLAQLKCTADVTGGRFMEAKTSYQLLKSMEDFVLPNKQVKATFYSSE